MKARIFAAKVGKDIVAGIVLGIGYHGIMIYAPDGWKLLPYRCYNIWSPN